MDRETRAIVISLTTSVGMILLAFVIVLARRYVSGL